jgi:hypothetical protein
MYVQRIERSDLAEVFAPDARSIGSILGELREVAMLRAGAAAEGGWLGGGASSRRPQLRNRLALRGNSA